MDTTTFSTVGASVPDWIHVHGALFFVLVVWTILWKGLALWHAGRRGSAKWFIVLLIVNTASILDIIYLFGVLKLKFNNLFSK